MKNLERHQKNYVNLNEEIIKASDNIEDTPTENFTDVNFDDI